MRRIIKPSCSPTVSLAPAILPCRSKSQVFVVSDTSSEIHSLAYDCRLPIFPGCYNVADSDVNVNLGRRARQSLSRAAKSLPVWSTFPSTVRQFLPIASPDT